MTSRQIMLLIVFLVGLPRVSLIQFPLQVNLGNWKLCTDFFKALVNDMSQWLYLRTIFFKTFPDQFFDPLHDFVLACLSEEHWFTIGIKRDTSYYACSNEINAEHMVWLQQHVTL
jgi:hypothetical protein